MRNSRLADALSGRLVAPPGQLAPQRARGQSVQMPKALPQQLRYGNVQPGIAQSQRFMGGLVRRQPASQVFFQEDYQPPVYPALNGLPGPPPPPPLSRLTSALIGASANPTDHAPPTTVALGGPQGKSQATGLTYGPQSPPNVATGLPGTPVSTAPNGSINSFTPGTTVSPGGVSLGQLLATAAQRGTRLPGGYYQF